MQFGWRLLLDAEDRVMAIEQGNYPRVTEIMKISDTAEGNGVYLLELRMQLAEVGEPEQVEYVSRPDDPYVRRSASG